MTIAEQLKQEGHKEGMLKGRIEGMLEGRLDVARTLLLMKMPRKTILQATGLTEEELAHISVS
ncbi:hypothetical protein [Pantoea sp. KPR_PJ]|uniref:hypothetical protein n=1 Tax=Pantoea sp. KPR_PJ TaxID=2738375 RepID=UPI003526C64B